ncbi:hypothetical protein LTR94_014925 [Friedmanniomyces endolithicus]|nr:hypothetical protein LTR94_014925 [Friedmanniomyces endolithicus]
MLSVVGDAIPAQHPLLFLAEAGDGGFGVEVGGDAMAKDARADQRAGGGKAGADARYQGVPMRIAGADVAGCDEILDPQRHDGGIVEHEAGDIVDPRLARQFRAEGGDDLLRGPELHRRDQGVTIGEMIIDGGAVDPGGAGEGGQGQRIDAAIGDQPDRQLDQHLVGILEGFVAALLCGFVGHAPSPRPRRAGRQAARGPAPVSLEIFLRSAYVFAMAILPILEAPDPRLRTISTPVEAIDDDLQHLIDDMFETMYDAPGIGLAAIQVGVPKRILVMDLQEPESDEEGAPPVKKPMVFINPEILKESDEQSVYNEGCLSVPDQFAEVERPAVIRASWMDRDGRIHEEQLEGLLATCLQHEMDHLEGVLFIDHLSRLKRDMLLKKLNKARRAA